MNSHAINLRVAHLSDLHSPSGQDTTSFAQNRVVAALLADLKTQAEEQPLDLIVFSGDLGFDGAPDALRRGRELLLDPLRRRYPSVPIILTPGNHDVDLSGVDKVVDIGLRAALTSRDAVQNRLQDPDHAAQARAGLEAWDELMASWDPGLPLERRPPYGYTYHLERAGVSVAIGSFDSAWRARGGMEDKGHLIVGADYVREFLEDCSDADLAIVTFHHPLDWLAEFDAAPLRVALENSQCLVLTGHDHVADPTLELTSRGAALYCRAPCSYADADYRNGYALIDIEPTSSRTTIQLRRWLPNRDAFGPDVETVEEGTQTFNWPLPSSEVQPVYHVPDTTVLKPFGILAREQSVLTSELDPESDHLVSDYMVKPRFWPVPHTEVFDRTVERAHRPGEADPLEKLDGKRALIVTGPKSSGVSTALLWLLERHYRQIGSHIPAYVETDSRFNLRRIQAVIETARTSFRSPDSGAPKPPVIVAIDDAEPIEGKALSRLIRLIKEDDSLLVLLGSHGNAHEIVPPALNSQEIGVGRVYIGPFGRRETRQLVARIAGPGETELVQQVLHIVKRQGLPRNPLNLAALISVITREPALSAAVNESGLLQSYVGVLLDNPIARDPEGLNMDYRRREHLLEEIARHVVETDSQRLARPNVEQLIIDYYRKIGWGLESAGHLVDSLIRRKVLVADDRGVGFRYPALLYLFAAKATFDNEGFRDRVFGDLLKYAPIIKHVAGLKRNDAETLNLVASQSHTIREDLTAAVTARQFDLIKDSHGWSKIRDLNDVRKLVRPRQEPPSEQELDKLDDEAIAEPEESADQRPFRDPSFARAVDKLFEASNLTASVLQSSELVADVKLRTDVMRELVAGWTVMTVLFAMEEDMSKGLREVLEPLFEGIADSEERESKIEHVARLFVISLMSLSLYIEVGSVHHQAVLENLLEDEEFMEETANALFTSMLYAMLHFPEWPKRLSEMYERHGDHPMVREVIRGWALEEYQADKLRQEDVEAVEDLLVRILTPDDTVDLHKRAEQGSKVRERLRDARTKSRWAETDARNFDAF